MNGFLLCHDDAGRTKNEIAVPEELHLSVDYTSVGSGMGLYTWGTGTGDIHIFTEKNQGVLILSGYITDIKGTEIEKDQHDIVCQLYNILNKDCSIKKLTSLAPAINGSFALIYVNFKQNSVYTLTDRVASRPIWTYTEKNELYISTHAIAIARGASQTQLRPAGIAAHLLYGTTVTPQKGIFQNIFSQQEGVLTKYNISTTDTQTSMWYQFQHAPDTSRNLKSWVKLTSDCFVKSAQRITNTTSNPMLFLSGGVDSRIAGAALLAAGTKPLLCTLIDTDNLETKVSKAVGKIFSCKHEITVRDEEWYLRAMREAMFNSHGVYSWAHSHFSETYRTLKNTHGVDTAILGDFCEAFSKACCLLSPKRTSVWSPQEFTKEFDTIQLHNYQPVDRHQTLGLLQGDYANEAKDELQKSITSRFSRLVDVSTSPAIVGDYFFRWQSAASMATFQMFNDVRSAGAERNLMFDNELHRLLEIMPASIRFDSFLGARIVNHLSPLAAIVPNANTLLPLLSPQWSHTLAKKVKPVMGKIRRLLLQNTYTTTGSWPHLPLLYTGNPKWKRVIADNLLGNSRLLPPEIFDRKAIERSWQMFCNGNLNIHSDIERLLGLSQVGQFLYNK